MDFEDKTMGMPGLPGKSVLALQGSGGKEGCQWEIKCRKVRWGQKREKTK